jgi:hypothetical protein
MYKYTLLFMKDQQRANKSAVCTNLFQSPTHFGPAGLFERRTITIIGYYYSIKQLFLQVSSLVAYFNIWFHRTRDCFNLYIFCFLKEV